MMAVKRFILADDLSEFGEIPNNFSSISCDSHE